MRLETDVKSIKEDIIAHNEHQRQDFDKLYEKIDSLSDSFAGKWVEKVTIGILISVFAGLLIYLVQVV